MDIKRRENETELSYMARVYRNKIELGLNNKEINALINEELGTSYAESTTRCNANSFNQGYNEALENGINEKKYIKEIEEKTRELKKERKKIQTANIEYNKLLREQARNEMWYEGIKESILRLEPLKCPPIRIIPNNSKTDAVLTMSDFHYGRECRINGLNGEIISEYNVDIFKNRMWDLLQQVVDTCNERKLNHLHIMALGDFIDGLLRVSQIKSLQVGVLDSVVQFSEFMATWLNKLSNFISIDYYQVQGNHDELRLLTGKKGDFPHENVSKLILDNIKVRLENVKLKDQIKGVKNYNVTIHDSYSDFIYFNILGVNVLGYHGEDKDLQSSLRWFRTFYNVPIDIVFGGHLHSQTLQTESSGNLCDCQCIRVSGICGIDDYSVKLRKSAKAGASMFIFKDGKGKTSQEDFWLN